MKGPLFFTLLVILLLSACGPYYKFKPYAMRENFIEWYDHHRAHGLESHYIYHGYIQPTREIVIGEAVLVPDSLYKVMFQSKNKVKFNKYWIVKRRKIEIEPCIGYNSIVDDIFLQGQPLPLSNSWCIRNDSSTVKPLKMHSIKRK